VNSLVFAWPAEASKGARIKGSTSFMAEAGGIYLVQRIGRLGGLAWASDKAEGIPRVKRTDQNGVTVPSDSQVNATEIACRRYLRTHVILSEWPVHHCAPLASESSGNKVSALSSGPVGHAYSATTISYNTLGLLIFVDRSRDIGIFRADWR
jgi:hypothetical protein